MVSKGADRFVLWPCYFDARLSSSEGRRVPKGVAVKDPDAAWVESASRKAGLDPVIEEKAVHPTVPYQRSGRVLVKRKGSKQAVLKLVAERMAASKKE